MTNSNTRSLTYIAIGAALIAVLSQISIPLGPVPFTLQTMALALLPAVLDGATACAAVGVYLLLGALGLPVFSGFGSGIASIVGPTGGFLWGFLLGESAVFRPSLEQRAASSGPLSSTASSPVA